MEDLSIDEPSNIAGMSHLINTAGIRSGFNPHELESEITGATRRVSNPAENLEYDLQKVMDYKAKPNMSDDLDALLNSINDVDQEQEKYEKPGTPLMVEDPELAYMTNEQKRQNVIGDVFEDINCETGARPSFSIEQEREEDEKSRKLEGIESLREILEDEGETLSRIPNVSQSSSLEEIDNVYKLLNLKNDRKRCCTFAEEGILMGAHGVEWAFDGEKSYFGRKPDMTDWHKSVQSKLRRMRHDTSNVVSQVMQQYNLGSGTRILLELIPSMFLYSRMRKVQRNDNLISDDDFNDGINTIRDFEKIKL